MAKKMSNSVESLTSTLTQELVLTSLPEKEASDEKVVRSGHMEFQSLYATDDMVTPSFTINRLGAPNNSTLMCGCENVSCPFCNTVTNIRKREFSLPPKLSRSRDSISSTLTQETDISMVGTSADATITPTGTHVENNPPNASHMHHTAPSSQTDDRGSSTSHAEKHSHQHSGSHGTRGRGSGGRRKAEHDSDVGKKHGGPFSCFPTKPKDPLSALVPKSVPMNDNIVRSGHLEFQTLYATNDMTTPSFTVNRKTMKFIQSLEL